jgi:uncharacterized protein YneF (UPF0154 family)
MMTGILVALLVIVTAALCFLLGTIVGVTIMSNEIKKKQQLNDILNQAEAVFGDNNKEDK